MDGLLKVLRNELQHVIDDIDAGHSNGTEEDAMLTIEALRRYSHKEELCTKYEACQYLRISRATFDNLVRDGKIPRGEKKYAGDNTLFWNKTDLVTYRKSNANKEH